MKKRLTRVAYHKKIVLFKLESLYGVDPTPTEAANAILTKEFKWMPMEGTEVSRDLEQAHMGAQGTIPTELHAKITFNVELSPSGTAGTAPAWGPLLRCCGVAETIAAATSVTYNPVSDSHESATLSMPKIEIQRPQGLKDVNGKVEWPLRAQALPNAGNDQWVLTLT